MLARATADACQGPEVCLDQEYFGKQESSRGCSLGSQEPGREVEQVRCGGRSVWQGSGEHLSPRFQDLWPQVKVTVSFPDVDPAGASGSPRQAQSTCSSEMPLSTNSCDL